MKRHLQLDIQSTLVMPPLSTAWSELVVLTCRLVSEYAKSKLDMPTQELIDLIFSDAMFKEAMQVAHLCYDTCSSCHDVCASLVVYMMFVWASQYQSCSIRAAHVLASA